MRLTGAGTAAANAGYFADAILDTELSGLEGHGFYWLQYYCEHVQQRQGRRKGRSEGRRSCRRSPSASMPENGFAHPAIEKGFSQLIPAAAKNGIAGMAVHNSYNAATLGYHTGYLAQQGLLAFGFTNSTPAIAPVGGTQAGDRHQPDVFCRAGRGPARSPSSSTNPPRQFAWTAVKLRRRRGPCDPARLGDRLGGQADHGSRRSALPARWRRPVATRASARA